jgi:hypothetical protein
MGSQTLQYNSGDSNFGWVNKNFIVPAGVYQVNVDAKATWGW